MPVVCQSPARSRSAEAVTCTVTYTKPVNASDLTYTVEVSSDLVTWLSGSNNTATISTTSNPDGITQTVVVRDDTPIDGTSKRFIRLNVTGP